MSEIRDSIYGFIYPSDKELQIINTSLFQRLRRIKQLAMAYLVYPGATHTRFEHSLGVFYIASLMANKLFPEKKDKEKIDEVRFAALLHDIGHGPFSHISEYILDKYFENGKTDDKEKIHEKITEKLILENKEINSLLAEYDREKIVNLLSEKRHEIPLQKQIISGPIDADKMDYLLRDSHYCGVKYGVFDFHRMLNTLTYFTDDDSNLYMGMDDDGINTLEQFVLAKYYMTTQVYSHKIRNVTDAMIVRGIELGIEKDGIEFLNKIYRYKDNEEYLDNYIQYYDDRVINEIIYSDKKGYAYKFFKKLQERNLLKRIFSENLRSEELKGVLTEEIKDKIIDINSKENAHMKNEIEKRISEIKLLKCEPEYVILNCVKIKLVKGLSKNSDSEGKIVLINQRGKRVHFEEKSDIFRSIDLSMKDIRLEVYAPIEYTDAGDKKEKIESIRVDILNILKDMGG